MLNEEKLREVFPNTTVYKDQKLIATFKAASIPAFLRDWILKRKSGADGKIADVDQLRRYMADIVPRREDVLAIKDEAHTAGYFPYPLEASRFVEKAQILQSYTMD